MIKLPTKKELKGLRLGQAIFNAIYDDNIKDFPVTDEKYITDKLFYIENEDLAQLLGEYLTDVYTTDEGNNHKTNLARPRK